MYASTHGLVLNIIESEDKNTKNFLSWFKSLLPDKIYFKTNKKGIKEGL